MVTEMRILMVGLDAAGKTTILYVIPSFPELTPRYKLKIGEVGKQFHPISATDD